MNIHDSEASYYLSQYQRKPREIITYYHLYLLGAFSIYIVVFVLSLVIFLPLRLTCSYLLHRRRQQQQQSSLSNNNTQTNKTNDLSGGDADVDADTLTKGKKRKAPIKLCGQRLDHRLLLKILDRFFVFWCWFLVGFPFVILSLFSLVPIQASIPVSSLFFIIGSLQVFRVNYRKKKQRAAAKSMDETKKNSNEQPKAVNENTVNHVASHNTTCNDGANGNGHMVELDRVTVNHGNGDHHDVMVIHTTMTTMDDVEGKNNNNNVSLGFWHEQMRNIMYYPLDVLLGIKQYFIVAVLVLIASIALAIALIMPTCHVCLIKGYSSTAVGRKYESQVCKMNEICRVYFTVPRDMSQSMIVNFHTQSHRPNATYVIYSLVGNNTIEMTADVKFFRMSEIKDQSRFQYWADLTDLKPDSVYTVTAVAVFPSVGMVKSEPKMFKTAPSLSSNSSVSFISGGDMEWSQSGIELTKLIAKSQPLFAVIAGDIAYENGIPSCYLVMDRWFKNWEKYSIQDSGLSTPMLTAIGNHEAGGFRKKRSQVGFYLRYFPHEIGLENLQQAPTYHEHWFAQHLVLYILDAHIISPIRGQQTEWLNDTMLGTPANRTNRIALYHASAYPVVQTEIADIVYDLRTLVVPLFEKYNLSAAFEHHYHVFFQSQPIRDNLVVDEGQGIRYFGQGAWGLTPRKKDPQMWYLDKYGSLDHVYLTTCSVGSCFIQSHIYNTTSQSVEVFTEHSISRS